jgi:hypothetical protein
VGCKSDLKEFNNISTRLTTQVVKIEFEEKNNVNKKVFNTIKVVHIIFLCFYCNSTVYQ